MQILCFGDSNTYGYDPRSFLGDRYDPCDRWPDLLAEKTGWMVVNEGANGRTIPRCADSVPPSDLSICDLLVVMLGTNDLLQGASAAQTADRMASFLRGLLPRFQNILLLSPPPMIRGAWVPTDELAEESVRLAEEYKLLAEKLNIPFADTRQWNFELAFDGVHFTEEGHHTFAKHIIASIYAIQIP